MWTHTLCWWLHPKQNNLSLRILQKKWPVLAFTKQNKLRQLDKTWESCDSALQRSYTTQFFIILTCAFIYVVTNSVKSILTAQKFHSQHKLGDVRWKQEEKSIHLQNCARVMTKELAPPEGVKKKENAVRYQINGVNRYWCKCLSLHTLMRSYTSPNYSLNNSETHTKLCYSSRR